MSENVERRILAVLGNPTTSPYGNPIPGLELLGADTQPVNDHAVRMAELAGTEPQAVVIRRLSEHAQSDQELIVTLREVGIVPNARVSVTRKDRGFVVTTPGHDGLELSEEMAHSIFVEKA